MNGLTVTDYNDDAWGMSDRSAKKGKYSFRSATMDTIVMQLAHKLSVHLVLTYILNQMRAQDL